MAKKHTSLKILSGTNCQAYLSAASATKRRWMMVTPVGEIDRQGIDPKTS